MKNIILKNGLIGGLIIATSMVIGTYMCYYNPKGFEPSYSLGFGGMLLAFVFIYLGIEAYRKKTANGSLSFGKAFQVGSLIAILISAIYVGVWLIEYYIFFPDFIEKYAQSELANTKPEELVATTAKMETYKEMYKNPLLIILLTMMEILPMGLAIALISALILKKK
jgi:hypothetical protein